MPLMSVKLKYSYYDIKIDEILMLTKVNLIIVIILFVFYLYIICIISFEHDLNRIHLLVLFHDKHDLINELM